jgi:ferredoxin/uncharacterized protein with FMN-binding domain
MEDHRESVLRVLRRPRRLLALGLGVAALFAFGRLFVLAGLLVVAIVVLRSREDARSRRTAGAVAALAALFLVLHGLAYAELERSRAFVRASTPIDLATVRDGEYEGTGEGANGPVTAKVEVRGGVLAKVTVTASRDPIYAFDATLAALVGRKTTALPETAGFLFRRDQSLRGLSQAIEDALRPALTYYRAPSPLARASFLITEHRVGRVALNALAVLLILVLAFDYAVQPILAVGTGQSLNCYNCQACVGVCPVKTAEGFPYPITMTLEARLGRYDHVERLAAYCVGCGRCAAKCPVGISAPSVASAAIVRKRRNALPAPEGSR